MGELEHEMRDRLSRTSKALMARLPDYGFPSHMVFETLAEVATGGMLEQYGPSAAAHMLRLRADALEAEENERVKDLLAGDDDGAAAPMAPVLPLGGFEPWQAHAADESAPLDLFGR